MGIATRGGIVGRPAQRYTDSRYRQSASIPGLYNAAGLARFFRARQNAGKTAAGTGFGAVSVGGVGDSFSKGYNQTNAIRDVLPLKIHRQLQALPWNVGGGGGRGYISGRAGSTAWPGGAATLSGQGIWTFDSNWTTGSAASINNLRSTTTSGQVRIFIDPRDDPQWREGVTDIAIVHGNEAVLGTLTWDYKYATSDTGFFTAGTGDITGTINMNAATQGGVFTYPAGLSSLDPTEPFILQISRTAGTIYFEGAAFFNNDKTSGFHYIDLSRTGAATGDATFTDADRLHATFTKRCLFGSTADSCCSLFLLMLGINDCNQELGTSAFQTRYAALIEHINSVSTGRSAVLMVSHACLDEALYSKSPPYSSYKAAAKELVSSYAGYASYFSFDEYLGNPDTAGEVDALEAFPFKYSDSTTHHPSNEYAEAFASAIGGICGMVMPN